MRSLTRMSWTANHLPNKICSKMVLEMLVVCYSREKSRPFQAALLKSNEFGLVKKKLSLLIDDPNRMS
jgi:hypothetical protein